MSDYVELIRNFDELLYSFSRVHKGRSRFDREMCHNKSSTRKMGFIGIKRVTDVTISDILHKVHDSFYLSSFERLEVTERILEELF